MVALITSICGVAIGALGLIATAQANQHINAISDLRKQILDELNKGVGLADDGLMETLYGQLQIELDAAQSQLNLYIASKSPGV